MIKSENLFQHLVRYGHDRKFEAMPAQAPTDATPGSSAKIELLRFRLENGEELHHPSDVSYPQLYTTATPNPELPDLFDLG